MFSFEKLRLLLSNDNKKKSYDFSNAKGFDYHRQLYEHKIDKQKQEF